MSPDQWRLIEEIFDAAKELDAPAREAWLRERCGDDEALGGEIASLLRHHGETGGVLGLDPAPRAELLKAIAAQAHTREAFLPQSMDLGTLTAPTLRLASDAEDASPPLLHEGMKVGPYRVLRAIGAGGMGIVYHAHDERLNRPVALKTLRSAVVDGPAERRLWREARVAASMNHPGICRLYDVGDCNGRIYLVMELLEGESLSRAIARGPVELSLAIDTILGVLDALDALHQKDLIHRDLKPSNIFLTAHGVKLLDFGLSRRSTRRVVEEEDATQLTPMAGTPFYLSPEQLAGFEPDARSDLFAAAVILVEMLAGHGSAKALSRGIPLSSPEEDLFGESRQGRDGRRSAAFEAFIRKSLARLPEERYQTARSMANDLRSARAAMSAPRPQPSVKRLIVLPFRILRPDAEFDFLSFSLPDAITNSLAALSSLIVLRSSAAASQYAGPVVDLRKVAAEAQVDFALTGTILRSGDQLRVATQLAEAPGGAVIWTQTSQLGIQDVFQLEDELVRRVVSSLSLPLTGRENWLLARDVPASPLSYEYYLRANQLSANLSQHLTARDLYLKCLEIDPDYAPAWARLGRSHRAIAKYGGNAEDFARADAAFRHALQLNPELNLTHSLYAYLETDSARAPQAMVRLLNRSAAHPNDPDLYAALVYACRFCGLLEASAAAHDRARALDPLIPTSVTSTWFMAGDYMAVHRNSARDSISNTHALIALGRDAEALELARNDERVFGDPVARETNPLYEFRYWTAVSLRSLLEGNRAESLAAMERTMKWKRGEELYHAAAHLTRLGELDYAVRILERVAEYGFLCYPAFARDQAFDPLRPNAQFASILDHVKTRYEEARRTFADAGGIQVLGAFLG